MELLPLAVAPIVAGIADIGFTIVSRIIHRDELLERGRQSAIANGQYQSIDRWAWTIATAQMEAARYALHVRKFGIRIGLAGMVGSLIIKEPMAAYGFASLAAAETIAAGFDLMIAGKGAIKEYLHWQKEQKSAASEQNGFSR